MLVLIGATPEGRKELVGFLIGVRESAQSWRELLVHVKRRGLAISPEIAVGCLHPRWRHRDTNRSRIRPSPA